MATASIVYSSTQEPLCVVNAGARGLSRACGRHAPRMSWRAATKKNTTNSHGGDVVEHDERRELVERLEQVGLAQREAEELFFLVCGRW